MRSFYHYMMTYRGKKQPDNRSRLADWMFYDHDFPKHAIDYGEISSYLEWNSPFPNALMVFDEVWDLYKRDEE
ncbi:YozE family protein [Virgibacillus dakarensis]|uniref:YozE family protein n=1 Tax=Bacillaceae TaxID=186817 RepID=UPI000B439B36|nr:MULTISPECIES: YozE family protein [Bacillaceae]MBT2218549.1 YozE family protein [Virgibacillus dakarensis]MTW85968.1 YozE family protein [Virgibacillus dakarensis]